MGRGRKTVRYGEKKICPTCRNHGLVQDKFYYGDGLQSVRYIYCFCEHGIKEREKYERKEKVDQTSIPQQIKPNLLREELVQIPEDDADGNDRT